jgi:hypothetical protein
MVRIGLRTLLATPGKHRILMFREVKSYVKRRDSSRNRRVYPSWLPPTPSERAALIRVRRQQLVVIGWLIALLPAGWAILAVTRSEVMLAPLTIFWIVMGISLAQRVTDTLCPRCHERLCQKRELPYWYGLFNQRCDACGLSLSSGRETD